MQAALNREMKIAFLCGSLEAGRDGVGDYTFTLATELQKQGHTVAMIALRDRFVESISSSLCPGPHGPVSALRLPAASSWSTNMQAATQHLERFNPSWVSLQFVCYAFHRKGLVYGLARRLSPLWARCRRHIMFHETWLCRQTGWGWKQCAVGLLQRLSIQRLVRAVRPNVMHTSNAIYTDLLRGSGIAASELRIFGNVPVLPEPGTEWIESRLRTVFGSGYNRDRFWLFGIFGGLPMQWPPEPLFTHLHRASEAAGKRPVILSLGRIGSTGASLWDRLASDYARHFTFLRLGEQTADRISECLSYLDYGLATTPRSIIGKSGATISMLEHGLPVIVNRDDAFAPVEGSAPSEPLLLRCDESLVDRLRAGPCYGPRASRTAQVATDFLNSLSARKNLAVA